jgi:serine/threonine protein kinase
MPDNPERSQGGPPSVGEIRFEAAFEPNTLIYDAETSVPARLGDAVPATPAREPATLERIAHFRIVGKIGEGGMGVIYRATDEYLQRVVALKVIGGKDKSVDTEHTQRLLREARAASRINHPNVVTIYAAGEADGVSFIAMELVDGRELSKIVGPEGLETERALEIAAQIADGLGAAHERGIVHRDVKPANVLVCGGDRIKILDFGLAKPWRATGERVQMPAERLIEGLPDNEDALGFYHTQAGVIWGSLRYMSPEQFTGDGVDARSDVFSLGVVLYQMLTGTLPFYAKRPREQLLTILRTEPPPVRKYRLRVPDHVQAIVTKALGREPDDRYRNGAEMAAALRQSLERARSFGDSEIEVSSSDAAVASRNASAPSSSIEATRRDLKIGSDRVSIYPAGSRYDAVVVSSALYPWSPRGAESAAGTAVEIDGTVCELVAADCPSPGTYRYFFTRWPENAVIRRVLAYTAEYVAGHAAQRRHGDPETRTGSIGSRVSGLFSRRRAE